MAPGISIEILAINSMEILLENSMKIVVEQSMEIVVRNFIEILVGNFMEILVGNSMEILVGNSMEFLQIFHPDFTKSKLSQIPQIFHRNSIHFPFEFHRFFIGISNIFHWNSTLFH